MEGSLARLRHDIESIGDPADELERVKAQLDSIERQEEDGRRTIDDLRARVSDLERIKAQATELQDQIEAHRREIRQLESAESANRERIENYLKLASEADAIRAGAERLAKARGTARFPGSC